MLGSDAAIPLARAPVENRFLHCNVTIRRLGTVSGEGSINLFDRPAERQVVHPSFDRWTARRVLDRPAPRYPGRGAPLAIARPDFHNPASRTDIRSR